MESKYKEVFKNKLFVPALMALQQVKLPPSLKVDVCLTVPSLMNAYFELWYNKVCTEIFKGNTFDPKRWYKVQQFGNLLIPQPTGGFNIGTPTKQHVVKQFETAMNVYSQTKNNFPCLMVITEPFVDKNFFNTGSSGLTYVTKDSNDIPALLYNKAFEALFKIESVEAVDLNVGKVFQIILNKKDGSTVKLLNWHANSSGGTEDEFTTLMGWATQNGIHFVMGDSNITPMKKQKKLMSALLAGIPEENNKDYSKVSIKKDRWEHDILLNNQLDKHGLLPDVDGMFVCKVNHDDGLVEVTKGGALDKDVVQAFSAYNEETSPILADHSLVKLFTGDFLLMAASGAKADDNEKGIFPKNEWLREDIKNFHERCGKPYTTLWVGIYHKFLDDEFIQELLASVKLNDDEMRDFNDKLRIKEKDYDSNAKLTVGSNAKVTVPRWKGGKNTFRKKNRKTRGKK